MNKKITILLYCATTLILLLIIFLISFETKSANDASRFDTIEQLVDSQTFVIDNAALKTVDKVFINGHFYSDKPPVFSVIAAAPYVVLHFFGLNFIDQPAAVIYLTEFCFSFLPFAALFIFLYFVNRKLWQNKNLLLLFSLLLAIGTSLISYSGILNQSIPRGSAP